MNSQAQEIFYRLTVLNPPEETFGDLKSNRFDGEEVVDIAYRFRSPFILYRNIKRYGLEPGFKSDTVLRLKTDYLKIIRHNLPCLKDFFELARLLKDEGIKIVPIKGVSAILDTYFDEGLRPTSDVDVLIDEDNLKMALSLLKKNGYEIMARYDILRTNHGQACLLSRPEKPVLDLHYRLFAWYEERYLYKIDSTRFFKDSFTKIVNGVQLNFLRKEDEFYYSLTNIFNNPRNFLYYLDSDSLVRVYGNAFDWHRVTAHLYSSGIRHNVIKIINFLLEKLKTPIPDSVLKTIPVKRATTWVKRIERDMCRGRMDRYGQQIKCLLASRGILDKISILMIYVKWISFKRLGFFRDFFKLHNNPGGGFY